MWCLNKTIQNSNFPVIASVLLRKREFSWKQCKTDIAERVGYERDESCKFIETNGDNAPGLCDLNRTVQCYTFVTLFWKSVAECHERRDCRPVVMDHSQEKMKSFSVVPHHIVAGCWLCNAY